MSNKYRYDQVKSLARAKSPWIEELIAENYQLDAATWTLYRALGDEFVAAAFLRAAEQQQIISKANLAHQHISGDDALRNNIKNIIFADANPIIQRIRNNNPADNDYEELAGQLRPYLTNGIEAQFAKTEQEKILTTQQWQSLLDLTQGINNEISRIINGLNPQSDINFALNQLITSHKAQKKALRAFSAAAKEDPDLYASIELLNQQFSSIYNLLQTDLKNDYVPNKCQQMLSAHAQRCQTIIEEDFERQKATSPQITQAFYAEYAKLMADPKGLAAVLRKLGLENSASWNEDQKNNAAEKIRNYVFQQVWLAAQQRLEQNAIDWKNNVFDPLNIDRVNTQKKWTEAQKQDIANYLHPQGEAAQNALAGRGVEFSDEAMIEFGKPFRNSLTAGINRE